jgi:serine protease Do
MFDEKDNQNVNQTSDLQGEEMKNNEENVQPTVDYSEALKHSDTINTGNSSDACDTNNQNTTGQNYGSSYNAGNTTGQNYNYSYNAGNATGGYTNYEPPKKKKTSFFKKIVVVAVCIAAVCGIGFGVKEAKELYESHGATSNANQTATNKETTTVKVATTESQTVSSTDTSGVVITDVSGIVEEVMPSIVAITSTTIVEDYYNYGYFFGYGSDDSSNSYEETGAGSGIIVGQTDTELLIVTNNHVVDGADSLSVQFINDVSVDAYTKGTDSNADLAIVSIPLDTIDDDTLEAIKIATLGDSNELAVGEGVIAIGNALGYGQSVTTGVISAKDRTVTIDEKDMVLLQTDAAINGGNSGGALINSKGEVIGINVAKYSSSSYSSSASIEGMGFAIPISSATDIIDELMNRETRMKVDSGKQGYLGISGYTVSEQESEKYAVPVGILVTDVYDNSAASKAGIQTQDVIVKFDGQTVSTMDELKELLEYYSAGEKVTVTVEYRDGREYKEKDVEVTLGTADTISGN